MFLFHTGSIKRIGTSNRSAMVCGFLFHTGSIKSLTPDEQYAARENEFLFHTGSIKSGEMPPILTLEEQFLFHTGSIKSAGETHPTSKRYMVSIPYWFD